jgi:hypothetical protein
LTPKTGFVIISGHKQQSLQNFPSTSFAKI